MLIVELHIEFLWCGWFRFCYGCHFTTICFKSLLRKILTNECTWIQITAIDVNREAYEIGLPIIRKAGVEHKIEFVESEAIPVLDKLLKDVRISKTFIFLLFSKCFLVVIIIVRAPIFIFLNLLQSGNEGSFDFAFVDADKINYWNYHQRLMKLLKVGGIVVYDNTLWRGTVAMPEESVSESMRPGRQLTIELNKLLAADSRVQISHAPLGDGITICKRIH